MVGGILAVAAEVAAAVSSPTPSSETPEATTAVPTSEDARATARPTATRPPQWHVDPPVLASATSQNGRGWQAGRHGNGALATSGCGADRADLCRTRAPARADQKALGAALSFGRMLEVRVSLGDWAELS